MHTCIQVLFLITNNKFFCIMLIALYDLINIIVFKVKTRIQGLRPLLTRRTRRNKKKLRRRKRRRRRKLLLRSRRNWRRKRPLKKRRRGNQRNWRRRSGIAAVTVVAPPPVRIRILSHPPRHPATREAETVRITLTSGWKSWTKSGRRTSGRKGFGAKKSCQSSLLQTWRISSIWRTLRKKPRNQTFTKH